MAKSATTVYRPRSSELVGGGVQRSETVCACIVKSKGLKNDPWGTPSFWSERLPFTETAGTGQIDTIYNNNNNNNNVFI